jgi:hypothetical protein
LRGAVRRIRKKSIALAASTVGRRCAGCGRKTSIARAASTVGRRYAAYRIKTSIAPAMGPVDRRYPHPRPKRRARAAIAGTLDVWLPFDQNVDPDHGAGSPSTFGRPPAIRAALDAAVDVGRRRRERESADRPPVTTHRWCGGRLRARPGG